MSNMLRLMLVSVALAAMAGCNGEQDFSDASLANSSVRGGNSTDPFDPNGLAVEVELVAGNKLEIKDEFDVVTDTFYLSAVISNIKYTCGNVAATVPTEGTASGFEAHRARCPISSREIEYFIGDEDNPLQRFSLGKAYIPVCSNREVQSQENSCTDGPGLFQISLADLKESPSRLAPDDPEATYRTALLAMIDADRDTIGVIEVPEQAHTVTRDNFNVPPATLFDSTTYANYTAFQDAWQDWVDLLALQTGETYEYPTIDEAEAYIAAGSNRIRAGLWSIFHNQPTAIGPGYVAAFRGQTDVGDPYEDYGKMVLLMDAVIMPNGEMLGLGIVQGLSEGQSDGNNDIIVLSDSPAVGETLYLGGAPASTIRAQGLLQGGTDLDLSGRIFNVAMYDGLEIDSLSGGTVIDFEVDYPEINAYDTATLPGFLDPDDDVARVQGTVLGEGLGAVGFQAARSGIVSPFVDTVLAPSLPEFYQLTLYQACVEDVQTGCAAFAPENTDEIGINYPSSIGGYVINRERPRSDFYLNGGRTNLEFTQDGYVITDRDANCSAVDPDTLIDGDGTQEYRVGFVSRTDFDSLSVNVLMFLVGPPDTSGGTGATAAGTQTISQFGAIISGRLDLLDPDKPIYRLSDSRFSQGVRAGWEDIYLPTKYVRDNQPLDEIGAREQVSLAAGAVEGRYMVPDGSGGCIAFTDIEP